MAQTLAHWHRILLSLIILYPIDLPLPTFATHFQSRYTVCSQANLFFHGFLANRTPAPESTHKGQDFNPNIKVYNS